jgi:hypothetical protein
MLTEKNIEDAKKVVEGLCSSDSKACSVIDKFLEHTTNTFGNQSDKKNCEKLKNEDTKQKYFKKTQNYMKDKNKNLKDKSLQLTVFLLYLLDMKCGN